MQLELDPSSAALAGLIKGAFALGDYALELQLLGGSDQRGSLTSNGVD